MVGEPRWSPDALYDHFDGTIEQLQKHFDDRLDTLGDEIDHRVKAVRDEMDTRGREQKDAIAKAETASQKLAETHNDLIRKGERDAALYATKDDLGHITAALEKLQSFQSKILGALALATVVVPIVTGTTVYYLTRTAVPVERAPATVTVTVSGTTTPAPGVTVPAP